MHTKTLKKAVPSSTLSAVLLIIAIYILRHIFFFNKVLILGEEGYRYYIYAAIADGKTLFKDIFYHHGIISPYTYGWILKIFGNELLNVRIASLLFVLISIILTFFIGKRILPVRWAAFFSFLAFCAYFTPFYEYGYPVAHCCGYLAIIFLTYFIYTAKPHYFFLSLFSASLACLHAPYMEGIGFNLAIFFSLMIYWFFNKNLRTNWFYLLLYIIGVPVLFIAFNTPFFLESDFHTVMKGYTPPHYDEIEKVNLFPFLFDFPQMISLITPRSFTINSLYFSLKSALYLVLNVLIPLFNFVCGIWYYYIRKDRLQEKGFIILLFIFLSITMSLRMFIYGISGTMDALLMAPSLFLFLYFLYKGIRQLNALKPKYAKLLNYSVISILILCYFFIQIPNFNPKNAETKLDIKGVKNIWCTIEEEKAISEMKDLIEQKTEPDDKIICVNMGGLLYVAVSERAVVFENDLFIFESITLHGAKISLLSFREEFIDQQKRKIMKVLQKETPKMLICSEFDWTPTIKAFPELKEFLETKYSTPINIGKYIDDNFSNPKNKTFHNYVGVIVYVLREEKQSN